MDTSIVNEFCNNLYSSSTMLTGAWFNKDNRIVGDGKWYGKLKQIESYYNDLACAVEMPSLHLALWESDLKGRRKENFHTPLVCAVDIDDPERQTVPIETLLEMVKPRLVVESSPGKYHLYWKLTPAVTRHNWEQYQFALAFMCGGDYHKCQRAALLRVPGFERVTKKGELFTPKTRKYGAYIREYIIGCPDSEERTLDKIFSRVSLLSTWEQGVAEHEEEKKRERAAVKALGSGGSGSFRGLTKIGGYSRNCTLYEYGWKLAANAGTKLGEHEVEEQLLTANEYFPYPLGAQEVRTISASALRYGNELWDKRRAATSHDIKRLNELKDL